MKKVTKNNITVYIAKIYNLCVMYQVAVYSEISNISSIPFYFNRKRDAEKYFNSLKKQI